MSEPHDTPQDTQHTDEEHEEQQETGQVSEVASFAGAGEPISDSQSVGGQPDMESGRADEGPQGPNANPHAGQRTH